MLVEGFQTRALPIAERKQNRQDNKDSFAATLQLQDTFVNGSQLELGKAAILNVVKEHSTPTHLRRVEYNLSNIETQFELQKYFYNMILKNQGLAMNQRNQ